MERKVMFGSNTENVDLAMKALIVPKNPKYK